MGKINFHTIYLSIFLISLVNFSSDSRANMGLLGNYAEKFLDHKAQKGKEIQKTNDHTRTTDAIFFTCKNFGLFCTGFTSFELSPQHSASYNDPEPKGSMIFLKLTGESGGMSSEFSESESNGSSQYSIGKSGGMNSDEFYEENICEYNEENICEYIEPPLNPQMEQISEDPEINQKNIGESGGMSSETECTECTENTQKLIGESGGMSSETGNIAPNHRDGDSLKTNVISIPNYFPTDLIIKYEIKGISLINAKDEEVLRNPGFQDFRDDLTKSGFYFDPDKVQINYKSTTPAKTLVNRLPQPGPLYPIVKAELTVNIEDQTVRWIRTEKGSLEETECESDQLLTYTLNEMLSVLAKHQKNIKSFGDNFTACKSNKTTHFTVSSPPLDRKSRGATK